MISDVLRDARDDIRRYLRDRPEVYADYRAEIEDVVSLMETLRQRLDDPTVEKEEP